MFLLKNFLDCSLITDAYLNHFKQELCDLLVKGKIAYTDLKPFSSQSDRFKQSIDTLEPEARFDERVDVLIQMNALTRDDLKLKEVNLSLEEERCLLLYRDGVDKTMIPQKMNQSVEQIDECFDELKRKLQVSEDCELYSQYDKLILLRAVV